MTAPWLLQTVASPLFTAGQTEGLAALLKSLQSPYAVALVYIVLSSIAAFALVASYRAAKDKAVAVVLMMAWIIIPSIQIFGTLGNPNELVSGWKHARYFFIGAVCFVMLLGIIADSALPIVRLTALSLLLTTLCAGIHQVDQSGWNALMLYGPSWRSEVAACGGRRPCVVQPWPISAEWTFVLHHR